MSRPSGNSPPLRLMVLAPNWLGDVIMHTPLLTLLHENRQAVAGATGRSLEIHLGVRGSWADLFHDDPRSDRVVVLDQGRRDTGAGGTARLASLLRKGRYDAAILCPPSLRTALAAWLARIPDRVGYRADGRRWLLTTGLETSPRGTDHYAREMMGLGRAWLKSLGLPASPGNEALPKSSLPGCAKFPAGDPGEGAPLWAVAPGTTYGEAKTWPESRLGEFMDLAISEAGVRIVLLGDAAARGFTEKLQMNFKGRWGEDVHSDAQVLDLTGKTDLAAAVGVLKSSAAFVGNDSGLMHLAAALGVPTVGVFGSSNPDWTSPLGRQTRAVVAEGFACRPCYRKTCNQDVFCLDTVSADMVLAAVLDSLKAGLPGSEGP